MRRILIVILLFCIASIVALAETNASRPNDKTINIGVLSFRSKTETVNSWKPLIDELNKKLPNYHFAMQAYSYKELDEAVANSSVDFVFTNPEHYVALEVRRQITRMATIVRVHNNAPIKFFGGVIFTKANRGDINRLSDLADKKIAAVSSSSLGGYLAQSGELFDAGMDIRDGKNVLFTDMPHDKVVMAVRDGSADVGFVRTNVLEGMTKDGKIKLQDFKIINNKTHTNFPFLVSTELYPEWPFSSMPKTDEKLVKSVATVLLQIPEGGEIARYGGYYSWSVPSGYESLKRLMQKLHTYPFNYDDKLTLADAIRKYALELVLFVLFGAIIMTILYIRAQMLKQRLDRQMEILEDEIDNRRKAERRLRLSASVFNNSSEGILITDGKKVILEVNRAFETLTGYSRDEVLGMTPKILKSGKHDKEFYQEMYKTINEKGSWQGEIWNRNKKGELYAELLSISSVPSQDGEIENYIAIFSDITNLKSQQERLAYLVNYDTMTGLANRRLLHERIEHAIHLNKRRGGQFALMFIDLDNFKYVNDTLGHEAGDELLKGIVERLTAVIRESDTLARMGGDEFVLLAENIEDLDDVAALAQKIVDTVSPSFTIKHTKVFTSASVGISIFPTDGEDIDTLMKKADMAMYQSKEHGKNQYCFFSESLENRLKSKTGLIAELKNAVNKKEFELYYQPQIDTRDGSVVGVEALVRWNHPERGIILPGEFIKTAEDDGVIIQISEWVVMKSFATMRIWRDRGAKLKWMSINISDKQFKDKSFVEKIRTSLDFFKLQPSSIKLELTEKMVMDNPKEAMHKLKALREIGVRLAIDDFGTGYSSLGHLKQFPIDQLKIDRSFVRDIGSDKSDEEITSAIIAMSRALGIEIVAEGVETQKQLDFLVEKECYLIQGYYFSRPKPVEELEKSLLF